MCRRGVIVCKVGRMTNSRIKGLRCTGTIMVGQSRGETSVGARAKESVGPN